MKKHLPNLAKPALWAALLFGSHGAFSQNLTNANEKLVPQAALEHLKKNQQALKLTDSDLASLRLSSQTLSKRSGVKHLYLQQMYQGIEIHNAISTVNMTSDDQLVNVGNQFVADVGKKVKSSKASLSAAAAVGAAAKHLNLAVKSPSVQKRSDNKNQEMLLSDGGISREPIPAKLVYQPMADGSLRLAWEVTIDELDSQNWWVIRVDAATGEFLDKNNLVNHCEFDNDGPNGAPASADHAGHAHQAAAPKTFDFATTMADLTSNYYNVYPLTTESPNHGPRVLISGDAADKIASPRGWHYTPLGTLTTTRGNNVYAYEDPNGLNPFPTPANNFAVPNYSPDGGPNLIFDFPIDFTKQPETYRDAAITNLFVWNNFIHDIWYQYGFDEVSGNFQFDNFDRGGLGNDFVRAEAQDARITSAQGPQRNNANFSTPVDGQLPRMQMYLGVGIPDRDLFRVTSPSSLAGSYQALEAAFSRPLTPTPVEGKLVLGAAPVTTPTGRSEEGCGLFTNATAIAGNIAVVYRGTCGFADKVQNAQRAGAVAVVVINNAPGPPIVMGGTPTVPQPAITIPAVMISQADGARIRTLLDAQTEVTVALKNNGSGPEFDGDFDNRVIAHEYGHGISNRLTGGPANVSCLQSQVIVNNVAVATEQMGEGWSDWIGMMLTIKPGDTPEKPQTVGTYLQAQPITGPGFRPAPYSTSFSVNNATYALTNNPAISAPHGVGFVWATMLWDMTWDLIKQYGYDEDLYNGTGGNNIAMHLVTEGMKLQVCQPGFVDGRDAILLADKVLYAGANQELIWRAFAKRGLGFSANQGSSRSRTDQVEAFDMPPVFACAPPTITVTPVGGTAVEPGRSTIYLGYGPQSVQLTASNPATEPAFTYEWSFAPGLSSTTVANPIFTPRTAGTYEFTVTATNSQGCSRTVKVQVVVVDVRCGGGIFRSNRLIEVCYNGRAICVANASVAAHLARGASLGKCQSANGGLLAEEEPAASELNLTASPNPTSASTTLAFTLTESGAYRLEVMNMQGALVSVVAQGKGEAGQRIAHEFNKGRLATGVYMVRLTSGKQSKFTRVVLQD